MKQKFTVEIDVPEDCTCKFAKDEMRFFFIKDDTEFKELMNEAWDVLPKSIEAMPIYYGQKDHDDGYASAFYLFGDGYCSHPDAELILDELYEAWGEEKLNNWIDDLGESLPNYAKYEEDDIYRYWDACSYPSILYVTRDFKTYSDDWR